MKALEVDVWVRGSQDAVTRRLESVSADAATWTDDDVRRLLTEMLTAFERQQNPGSTAPPVVTLRGFSWIVSPYEGGVVVHLEMQSGTASAGPVRADVGRLTAMIARVMTPNTPAASVH